MSTGEYRKKRGKRRDGDEDAPQARYAPMDNEETEARADEFEEEEDYPINAQR